MIHNNPYFNLTSYVETFTEGDCWRLALMLRDFHDFPIAFFVSAEQGAGLTGETLWKHAFNILPDGRAIDITGVFTQDELMATWGKPGELVVALPNREETDQLLIGIEPVFSDVHSEYGLMHDDEILDVANLLVETYVASESPALACT